MNQQYTKSAFFKSASLVTTRLISAQARWAKRVKHSPNNEQNRPNLEELQQRKIGSFWSTIGSGVVGGGGGGGIKFPLHGRSKVSFCVVVFYAIQSTCYYTQISYLHAPVDEGMWS